MAARRPFCSDVALENAEPLAATASRVDHWILLEYRGLWSRDALAGSGLSDQVKRRLREQAAARPHTKLLLVRRTVRRGRSLYQALAELAEEDWVWQISHVGGDRFAGNVVVLPEGLYFGRVGPGEAWPVLEDYLGGRIDLDHYRGRSCYSFPIQAAERVVREAAGLIGIDDVELVAERPVAVFRAGGRQYEVDITAAPGRLNYLTCTSQTLRHPRHYAARILRESAA